MATQRALAAAMLAMALVATCVAESSDPVTLASLLQKQKGGSIQAATSYPEAHSTRACLKLKNVQNCDVFGLASALYLE
jgi:hypothetical protein